MCVLFLSLYKLYATSLMTSSCTQVRLRLGQGGGEEEVLEAGTDEALEDARLP